MRTLAPPRREESAPPLFFVVLLTAAAGGMGWGIRGQYGHETGAMVPGVLVGLTVACLFARHVGGSLQAARLAALTAIGISFGGSMTYGQTVGLTHDRELVGNWDALWWGLWGLFIKGGIWIGIAGGFLGIGLAAVKHRALDVTILLVAMVFLLFAGAWYFNEPFHPSEQELPSIYFSDHWDWEPDKEDLTPRRERWGGLLAAMLGMLIYLQCKRDSIARNLTLIGFLSGGFGFALGQCLQAAHAWNTEAIDTWLGDLAPHINWWNMMETTFGLILGGGLGLGVWLQRHRLSKARAELHQTASDSEATAGGLTEAGEFVLLAVHVVAVAVWNFASYGAFDHFADLAFTMGILPTACVLGGRYAPYVVALPVVAFPIVGKTMRQLEFRLDPPYFDRDISWILLFAMPLVIMIVAAWYFAARRERHSAWTFSRWALLLATWFYFGLNFIFFELPWPWQSFTGRTPNAIIFLGCAILLTLLCLWPRRKMELPG